MSTGKRNWEEFGKEDPYYWVTTDSKYKDDGFTEDVRKDFFESADQYLDSLFKVIRAHLDVTFSPQRAFDFGCGVGRITIPLARRCKYVFGVDVAESMIAEARKNSEEQSLGNIQFSTQINSLPPDVEPFDFVHSIYVFQHIRVEQGLQMFIQLIDLLKKNGVGAIHFIYCRRMSFKRKFIYWSCLHLPFFNNLNNIRKGKAFSAPMYEMNDYSLNELFLILKQKQCEHIYTRYTREGPYSGVILFFQKNRGGHGEFLSLGDIP